MAVATDELAARPEESLDAGRDVRWQETRQSTGASIPSSLFSMVASPIVVEDYVYLLGSGGGKITIVDAATGALLEQTRLPGAAEFWASPWANEGLVYCLDASGKTFVIKPGPSLEVVSVNTLTGNERARFWSSPAISAGTIFIRSDDALYAVSDSSN